MKNYCILLVLMLSLKSIAQDFIPIPESDVVWIQASFLYNMNGHEHSTVTNPLSFGQDTIAGGQTYHKLEGHEIVEWIDGWGNPQNYATGTNTAHGYKIYFRQDIPAKKVYAWLENRDTLLYDFDLTIGQVYPETATNINYPNLKVMGQDSIQLLDGIYHKKWLLGTESADSGYISLIEGVGASSGFSLIMYPLFEQSGAIMCMKESNTQIYENWGASGLIPAKYSEFCESNVSIDKLIDNSSEYRLWPNPATNELNISCDNEVQTVTIFDMYGQILINEFVEGTQLRVNIESLRSGQYLVKLVDTNQKIIIRKLIK
jgi:hypothetical protein